MANFSFFLFLLVDIIMLLPKSCIRPPTMLRHPQDTYLVMKDSFLPTNYTSPPYYQRRDLINKSISLDCLADGDPKPKYYWIQFDSLNQEFLDNVSVYELAGTSKDPYLKKDYKVRKYDNEDGGLELNNQHEHLGYYKCFAYNDYGMTFSKKASVSLVEIKICSAQDKYDLFKSKEILNASEGHAKELKCVPKEFTIHGVPNPRVYWMKGSELVTYRRTLINEHGDLWFSHVEQADNSTTDADLYTCIAETEYQSLPIKSTRLVIVKNPAKDLEIPKYLGIQSNAGTIGKYRRLTVNVNQSVSVGCFSTGRKSSTSWILPDSLTGSNIDLEGPIVHIKQVKLEYEGWFYCSFTGRNESLTFSMVLQVNEPATIIEEPQNLTKYEGETAEVRCVGVGKPQPVITWFKNRKKIQGTHRGKNYSTSYNFPKLDLLDTATYGCLYENTAGSFYRDFYINVVEKQIEVSSLSTLSAIVAPVIVAALLILVVMISIVLHKKKQIKSKDYGPTSENSVKICLNTLNLKDPWHFNRDRLQLLNILDEGNFGRVYIANAIFESKTGGQILHKVAVKTTLVSSKDSAQADLLQELDIMKRVGQHCNVVRLIGACTEKTPVLLIMELLHQSLINFLQYSRDNKHYVASSEDTKQLVTSKMLMGFAFQIARGMQHVSSQGIIHRDLAARNILLNSDLICKIADFGLARNLNDKEIYVRQSNIPLPIRWMAPEVLRTDEVSIKSDIWSFGVVLWELVTLGGTPYPGKRAQEVKEMVINGRCMKKPNSCSNELYSLMLKCWNQEPQQRSDFAASADFLASMLERDADYIHFEDLLEQDFEYVENIVDSSNL